MSELLSSQEIFQLDTLVHLVIEADLVESLLQVPSQKFIVNKCLPWKEMQVLLKCLTDEMLTNVFEKGGLRGLAL